MTPFTVRLAGAALAAVLGAPAAAHAQVEVRMWTLLSGGDGARMAALVDRFNASQREVRVTSTTLKWGEPFYTKLITSSVVGAGPDIATVHLSRMTNLAGGGVLRPIAPGELRAAGLNPADFYPRQWEKSQHAGRTYAIPLDLHPLVLYYNKSLVGKAGLLGADGRLKPIEGIDALTGAFRAVRQATGRHGMTMESNQSSYAVWRLWLTMLAQRNAPLIQDGRFAYGAAGVESLAQISSWFARGYAQAGLNYAASTSQFIGGNAGFMINGVWEVPEMLRSTANGTLGFEYGIVPMPRMYANQAVWADSHAFAIPASEGRPMPPAKLRAVMRFIAFVSKNSLGWAEGGHVLAYRPAAESPAALALEPNRQYADVPRHVVYAPDAWYMGAAGPLEAMASKYLPAALSSQLSPGQALRMFETEAALLLRKRAPRY